MKPGECCVAKCELLPTAKDDVFCSPHWRQLPRWARVELVTLRNAARRGGRSATTLYVKALVGAESLFRAFPVPAESSGPE